MLPGIQDMTQRLANQAALVIGKRGHADMSATPAARSSQGLIYNPKHPNGVLPSGWDEMSFWGYQITQLGTLSRASTASGPAL